MQTETTVSPVGQSSNEAGGQANDGGDNQGGTNSNEGAPGDTVKYETYRKILSEKKKRDEENAALRDQVEKFQSERKTLEQQELEKQNKWKEIADLRAKELEEKTNDLAQFHDQRNQATKLDAFLGNLGNQLPKQYWGLVDLDSIKLNPDTKEIDEMSVTSAVEVFRKSYPEILLRKAGATLPTNAPTGSAAATRGDVDFKNLSASERNKILAAELISKRQTG